MNLVKYFNNNLLDELRVFNNHFPTWINSRVSSLYDSDWLKISDDEYKLEIEIPGYEKDEIKIFEKKNQLYVKSENENRGKYSYSTTIPKRSEGFEASLKNGILTIILKVKPIPEETENYIALK